MQVKQDLGPPAALQSQSWARFREQCRAAGSGSQVDGIGAPEKGGGALPAPWTLPHPQRGVSTGHFAWRDRGWGRQAGKTHMASYQPGQGGEGKQAGPGQPLPQPQGVDAGGWVPRTQNKPAFYFQVLQWTLSKVPGEEEWAAGKVAGRGRGWTEN